MNVRFQMQDRSFFDVQPDEFYAFGYETFFRRERTFLRSTYFEVLGAAAVTRQVEHTWTQEGRSLLGSQMVVRRFIIRSSEPFVVHQLRNVWWLWPHRKRRVIVTFLRSVVRPFYVRRYDKVQQWEDRMDREVLVPRRPSVPRKKGEQPVLDQAHRMFKEKFELLEDGTVKKRVNRDMPLSNGKEKKE